WSEPSSSSTHRFACSGRPHRHVPPLQHRPVISLRLASALLCLSGASPRQVRVKLRPKIWTAAREHSRPPYRRVVDSRRIGRRIPGRATADRKTRGGDAGPKNHRLDYDADRTGTRKEDLATRR